jgi:hypothetical protein
MLEPAYGHAGSRNHLHLHIHISIHGHDDPATLDVATLDPAPVNPATLDAALHVGEGPKRRPRPRRWQHQHPFGHRGPWCQRRLADRRLPVHPLRLRNSHRLDLTERGHLVQDGLACADSRDLEHHRDFDQQANLYNCWRDFERRPGLRR